MLSDKNNRNSFLNIVFLYFSDIIKYCLNSTFGVIHYISCYRMQILQLFSFIYPFIVSYIANHYYYMSGSETMLETNYKYTIDSRKHPIFLKTEENMVLTLLDIWRIGIEYGKEYICRAKESLFEPNVILMKNNEKNFSDKWININFREQYIRNPEIITNLVEHNVKDRTTFSSLLDEKKINFPNRIFRLNKSEYVLHHFETWTSTKLGKHNVGRLGIETANLELKTNLKDPLLHGYFKYYNERFSNYIQKETGMDVLYNVSGIQVEHLSKLNYNEIQRILKHLQEDESCKGKTFLDVHWELYNGSLDSNGNLRLLNELGNYDKKGNYNPFNLKFSNQIGTKLDKKYFFDDKTLSTLPIHILIENNNHINGERIISTNINKSENSSTLFHMLTSAGEEYSKKLFEYLSLGKFSSHAIKSPIKETVSFQKGTFLAHNAWWDCLTENQQQKVKFLFKIDPFVRHLAIISLIDRFLENETKPFFFSSGEIQQLLALNERRNEWRILSHELDQIIHNVIWEKGNYINRLSYYFYKYHSYLQLYVKGIFTLEENNFKPVETLTLLNKKKYDPNSGELSPNSFHHYRLLGNKHIIFEDFQTSKIKNFGVSYNNLVYYHQTTCYYEPIHFIMKQITNLPLTNIGLSIKSNITEEDLALTMTSWNKERHKNLNEDSTIVYESPYDYLLDASNLFQQSLITENFKYGYSKDINKDATINPPISYYKYSGLPHLSWIIDIWAGPTPNSRRLANIWILSGVIPSLEILLIRYIVLSYYFNISDFIYDTGIKVDNLVGPITTRLHNMFVWIFPPHIVNIENTQNITTNIEDLEIDFRYIPDLDLTNQRIWSYHPEYNTKKHILLLDQVRRHIAELKIYAYVKEDIMLRKRR